MARLAIRDGELRALGVSDLIRPSSIARCGESLGSWLAWNVENGEDSSGERHLSVLLGTSEDVPRLAYVIDGPAAFRRFDPPAPLSDGQALAFISQRNALAAIPQPPPARYERIALDASAIGEPGALVYVLSESANPSDVVLGPHYRVHLDDSFEAVIDVTAVSDDRAVVPRLRGESVSGSEPPGIRTRLQGFGAPTEVHVLESLRHGNVPLLVSTPRGTWRVKGDAVAFAAN